MSLASSRGSSIYLGTRPLTRQLHFGSGQVGGGSDMRHVHRQRLCNSFFGAGGGEFNFQFWATTFAPFISRCLPVKTKDPILYIRYIHSIVSQLFLRCMSKSLVFVQATAADWKKPPHLNMQFAIWLGSLPLKGRRRPKTARSSRLSTARTYASSPAPVPWVNLRA